MAVTSWTSEGMDWADLTAKLPYFYGEALRQAIVERANAANETVPAILASAFVRGDLTDWCDEFQTLMTALIPKYVDYTDNAGDWDGVSTGSDLAPYWTEANLLTEIGAASRLPAAAGRLLSAAWLKQQYLLLNELLWTKIVAAARSDLSEVKVGADTTRGAAETDFLADGYSDAGPGAQDNRGTYSDQTGLGATNVVITRKASSNKWPYTGAYPYTLVTALEIWTGAKAATDFYYEAASGSVNEWNDEGLGYGEDTWVRLSSGAAIAANDREDSQFTKYTTVPPAPSDDESIAGWQLNPEAIILLWDVTDGFDYVA